MIELVDAVDNEKYFMESKRAQKMLDLEKDRIERYRSECPRRGFATSWHMDIIKPDLTVGDNLTLSTCYGKSDFTVISISDKGIATVECGDIQSHLIWQGDNVWRYNNRYWNKSKSATIIVQKEKS